MPELAAQARQPGARDLLLAMKKRGLTLTVATSAKAEELQSLLRQTRIDDLIDTASTSSDASSSKPDPDIVLAAIERSGLPSEELVMLGDTPYDIDAAKRAGVAVIALRAGGTTDAVLQAAHEVYDDPADLLAHYETSLFGVHRKSATIG